MPPPRPCCLPCQAHKKALKQQGECEARLSVIREQIEERGGNFGLDDDLPGGGAGAGSALLVVLWQG